MNSSIFQGKWICDPRFAALKPLNVYHREHAMPNYGGEHPKALYNVHACFKKEFALKKQPGRYILRFSADDYGKIYINGAFAGQGPAPGYTGAYNYHEFDITGLLRDGENQIRVHVYYQGLINRVWVSGDLRMGVIADLLAPDGTAVLSTDRTWGYAPVSGYTCLRKTGYDTQFLEDFDSRIAPAGFSPAAERVHDDIVLRTTPAPALQVYERLPVCAQRLAGGGLFYDFGSEVTASLHIKAQGKDGDTIRILCGEELEDSPVRVRYEMRCNCVYDETWTLAEGENELFQYDYKGFRYVTLVPVSDSVSIEGVTAVVRHAPFDDAACILECEDKVLSEVFNICKNGVKFGTQEVYVDCPTREKGQYAGDMTVTSAAQLWLTGDVAMLEKAIRDQAHSAAINPGLMAVTGSSLMQEIADYSLQFPLLLLRHYEFTGGKAFLADMLPVAEGLVAHFARFAREDGLLTDVTDKWNIVDWPENLRDDYDFPLTKPIGPGAHNVLNAFYVGCVLNVEQIRRNLGLENDGAGTRLASAFNAAFFRPELGLYVDAEDSSHHSLHANVLAPFYGFAPKGFEETIGSFLAEKGLCCGVYMAYFLLRALCRLGRHDDVYRLITSTGENSWYNMVREGATTCFEAWGKDKKWNASLCHPWASAPIIVLIEDLLSVSPCGMVGTPRIPADAGRIRIKIPTRKGFVWVDA